MSDSLVLKPIGGDKDPGALGRISERNEESISASGSGFSSRSAALDKLVEEFAVTNISETKPSVSRSASQSIKGINSSSVKPLKEYMAKLCFLMDMTGSMEPQRDAVIQQIANVVDDCCEKFPNVDLQLAFVGYRDVDMSPQERYVIINWTPDPGEFGTTLSRIGCHGGGDEAEDVLGGLQSVLNLDWDRARIKVCFHLGDSPHHGPIFSDPSSPCQDSHPDLQDSPVPYGDLMDELAARKIDYYFGTIENPRHRVTTNRMAELFRERYDGNLQKRNRMRILDMRNFDANLFFEYVQAGLSRSVLSFLGK